VAATRIESVGVLRGELGHGLGLLAGTKTQHCAREAQAEYARPAAATGNLFAEPRVRSYREGRRRDLGGRRCLPNRSNENF
jgi:hypothetical protein